jgi:multiple sugar transport system substrate-binding protein
VTALTGMTWNHPRGHDSLLAATAEFTRAHPGVEVSWDARSLQDFADLPLAELADRYDLLVFDHPFIGAVAASKLLVPLDEILPPPVIADAAAHSVGPSHESYVWDDHPWALAIDAACHVSAYRPDLVPDVPAGWAEAVGYARRARAAGGPLLALPAKPIDSLLAFITLLANDANDAGDVGDVGDANDVGDPFGPDGGIAEPDRAVAALELLAQLLAYAHPLSLESNPIQLLELMATTDEVAYLPLTFGYVTYATPGVRPKQVRFGPIPAGRRGIAGGVLGGAGLGISARSAHVAQAASFLAFVASGAVQTGSYVAGGGQPGHRSAWLDPGVNARHGGFFADTLPGIDAAYLRPRWPGYLAAQTAAAELVHAGLTARVPARDLVAALDEHLTAAQSLSGVGLAKGRDPHGN